MPFRFNLPAPSGFAPCTTLPSWAATPTAIEPAIVAPPAIDPQHDVALRAVHLVRRRCPAPALPRGVLSD